MFWILESVLESGNCFWILGSVLDSGKCFWILEVFLDSRKCFGIWEVCCPYEPPYEAKQNELFLRFFNLLLTVSVSD